MRIVGIGVDLVRIERIRRILRERPGFRHRCFTEAELADADERPDPAPSLAARWAAREAAVKALGGVPGMRWKDIHVATQDGTPRLGLEGPARDRAEALHVREVHLSLTHERDTAAAFCVAVGD